MRTDNLLLGQEQEENIEASPRNSYSSVGFSDDEEFVGKGRSLGSSEFLAPNSPVNEMGSKCGQREKSLFWELVTITG